MERGVVWCGVYTEVQRRVGHCMCNRVLNLGVENRSSWRVIIARAPSTREIAPDIGLSCRMRSLLGLAREVSLVVV